ncbi:GIY-YIG nuclease family protein [Salinibacter ruber]|uniref:GIY-YIG nuclease family protein n=1 Tax=Salinibacter ruber TaxID=146919 RepID=UPI002168BCBD|nr:GIY-YIG nuclease family protein [Salinibacter ruber]MCS3685806.1 hypothetical protein [Salinibacter ruber]
MDPESLIFYVIVYVLVVIGNVNLAQRYNHSKVGVALFSILAHLLVTLYLVVVITASSREEKFQNGEKVAAKGSVYVLINPALSDVVKIGYTTRSAEVRARELSGTGVPGKWQVAHEISTGSPKQVEKTVHQKLSRQKVRDGGEFFQVSPEKAARVIQSVAQG